MSGKFSIKSIMVPDVTPGDSDFIGAVRAVILENP